MALTDLDWSLVQAFLTVAEEGSLSAAARRLGASQPTLGRHVRSLEQQLGAELFRRREKGLALTETGTSLLDSARAMRDAAHRIRLRAAGEDQTLEGSVRITASVAVATHHLPRLLASIRAREPLISIELFPSDRITNLHYREADIAVRMLRPTPLDLVTRHLGDLPLGAFAAKSYAARRGLPSRPEDLLHHDVIGFDRHGDIIEGFRRAGFPVARDWFKVRCDDQAAYWQLVRGGCGIGFGQTSIGRRDPDLVEVPVELGLPRLQLWLTAHETILRTPRIRRVWELLAEGLLEVVEPAA